MRYNFCYTIVIQFTLYFFVCIIAVRGFKETSFTDYYNMLNMIDEMSYVHYVDNNIKAEFFEMCEKYTKDLHTLIQHRTTEYCNLNCAEQNCDLKRIIKQFLASEKCILNYLNYYCKVLASVIKVPDIIQNMMKFYFKRLLTSESIKLKYKEDYGPWLYEISLSTGNLSLSMTDLACLKYDYTIKFELSELVDLMPYFRRQYQISCNRCNYEHGRSKDNNPEPKLKDKEILIHSKCKIEDLFTYNVNHTTAHISYKSNHKNITNDDSLHGCDI